MMRVRTRRLAAIVLPALFVVALSGCSIFAPDEGDVDGEHETPDYRLRTSPGNVMHNIQQSYVWMNPDQYLECLSEDFMFFPAAEDVGGPIPEEWYKSDERVVHEAMFDENGNVDSVTLQLTNTAIEVLPGLDPVDPLDDIHKYTEDVDLYVHLHGDLSYHASTPSRFHIRVDEDQTGPNGEILYEIFEWHDSGPPKACAPLAALQDPSVETISLSQLRAIYQE